MSSDHYTHADYLQSKALELDVTGWVRNRRDGRVEVTAEGYQEDLEALLKWLHTGRSKTHTD
jgi:acylphosphatase